MKRVIAISCALIVAFIVLLVGRALMFTPPERPPVPPLELPSESVATRLAKSLTFRTISGETFDAAPFRAMQAWMSETYPHFYAATSRETFEGESVLFTWPGRDPDRRPVLFLAHQDVVSIERGTEADWAHSPFGGVIAPCGDESGTCIWGRGAIDMKAALIGLLEGAESLARTGYVPERTMLFAFGHDEEVGGSGASAIAKALKSRGVTLDWILDEGLLVTDGITPGVDAPVAYIGIAEKGYLSLELIAKGQGGHSSMPPSTTAVGQLARAVTRLEAHPFPARLDGLSQSMFAEVGPYMPFGLRFAFANQWLLESLILSKLTAKTSTNATVRTTQAATMFTGSPQDNILPQAARAVFNFRLHPRDSIESVTQRVRRVINDDTIKVRPLTEGLMSEPSRISSVDAPGYRIIREAIHGAFPKAIVAPGLFIAATDSRHFAEVATDIYRFHPILMRDGDGARIHGTNERIRTENFRRAVAFYGAVIKNAGR